MAIVTRYWKTLSLIGVIAGGSVGGYFRARAEVEAIVDARTAVLSDRVSNLKSDVQEIKQDVKEILRSHR